MHYITIGALSTVGVDESKKQLCNKNIVLIIILAAFVLMILGNVSSIFSTLAGILTSLGPAFLIYVEADSYNNIKA